MLLRTGVEEIPKMVSAVDEKIKQIDPTLPHAHFTPDRAVPSGVGPQKFPKPNADLIVNSRKGLLSNNGMVTGKISMLAKRISNNLVR